MTRTVEEMVAEQLRRSELARQLLIDKGHLIVNPVITISRTMGSGGRVVARRLADDLGLSLWDRELIDLIAHEAEIRPEVVEAFDEKTVSEVELLVRAALGDYESTGFLYARHLGRTVAMIASVGNAIILGRGANFLLPDALNVRMDASLGRRIENMCTYEGTDCHSAEVKLRRSDREREQYIRKVFGRDKVRMSHFDICLWMDGFSAADAARVIEAAYLARFRTG